MSKIIEKEKELAFESMCLHLQVCKTCQKLPEDEFCELAWVCHGETLAERGYSQKEKINDEKITDKNA